MQDTSNDNQHIEEFCKNPNKYTISKLRPEILNIFYDNSKKAMKLKQKWMYLLL